MPIADPHCIVPYKMPLSVVPEASIPCDGRSSPDGGSVGLEGADPPAQRGDQGRYAAVGKGGSRAGAPDAFSPTGVGAIRTLGWEEDLLSPRLG